MDRESIGFDILIVGAGPSGLSAAIRFKQLDSNLNVVVLEKGSEVGAHIISGAIFETRTLDELLPDWQSRNAPSGTPVTDELLYYFISPQSAVALPGFLTPNPMHNIGNTIISLGKLCRWLAEQAENLGVQIITGYTAVELIFNDSSEVQGVITDDKGIDRQGNRTDSFSPGVEVRAKYTLLAEGSRGHLGKAVIDRFQLNRKSDTQHYALGIKEIWQVDPNQHFPGLVLHGTGWPLSEHQASGGFFLYHISGNRVEIGLITDLNYSNPFLSPYEEFQRLKTHPQISQYLNEGKRLSYGARAITKGGLNALPEQHFPGGIVIGCDAGMLNSAKLKGIHTAMKSGMLAAEAVAKANREKDNSPALRYHEIIFKQSWLYAELYRSRNYAASLHRFGNLSGGAFNLIDQNLFSGRLPINIPDRTPDHTTLRFKSACSAINYPKADGKLTFDLMSSVYLSNTCHEQNQPVHLKIRDEQVLIEINLHRFAGPEQYYCPAGVYEYFIEENEPRLSIKAENCLHCKTCDIKDPSQNIYWIPPEGSGGPNYSGL